MFIIGFVTAVAAWLVTGAAGGDPLIALHSAATNAEVNNNPRGLSTALTHVLPALASPSSWLIVVAAATAVLVALHMRRTHPILRSQGDQENKQKTRHATVIARQRQAEVTRVEAVQLSRIFLSSFIGIGMVAYLAQGFIGTPLVARYLLLPALLCIPLASVCIILAGRMVRSSTATTTVRIAVGLALVISSIWANVSGWNDVTYAHHLRTEAFTSASELLDTDLATTCEAPVVVRSPAIVALTALALERPLRDITVGNEAGTGVLLQPLTIDAAELAGYGPLNPLTQQTIFPTDAPPRQSNAHWALYSTCQP